MTLWDLSVELDEDEQPSQQAGEAERLKDVPAQLLFAHQGQK